MLLYIPIWLYSNGIRNRRQKVYRRCFTFQSGYIQMGFKNDELVCELTLHSNLVIFKYVYDVNSLYPYITLHSNLVIFKSCGKKYPRQVIRSLHSNLVIFKYKFIESNGLRFYALHSNLVIFKFDVPFSAVSPFDLYIPIWLYSN